LSEGGCQLGVVLGYFSGFPCERPLPVRAAPSEVAVGSRPLSADGVWYVPHQRSKRAGKLRRNDDGGQWLNARGPSRWGRGLMSTPEMGENSQRLARTPSINFWRDTGSP